MGVSAALSIIAIDRILDIAVLLALYGVVLLLAPEVIGKIGSAGALLLALVLGAFAAMWLAVSYRERILRLAAGTLAHLSSSRRERWQQRAESVLDGLQILRDRRTMCAALVWSLIAWLLSVLGCHVVLLAFWPDAPPAASVLSVCLSAFSVTIVTVPAGIGVMHASLFFSVALFGMDHQNALLFAIVYHALIFGLSVVLGLIGLRPAGLTLHELATRIRQRS